jgi:hypothetical protein
VYLQEREEEDETEMAALIQQVKVVLGLEEPPLPEKVGGLFFRFSCTLPADVSGVSQNACFPFFVVHLMI